MENDLKNTKQVILAKGVTLWLTGLPCSGKSTIAGILEARFREWEIKAEVLDGDAVRPHLSQGLGYSKEDRDTNIRRIGFVCQLLTRNGIVAIASVVSPYRSARDHNRRLIRDFIEIYVRASVTACEKRDVKGHYRKVKNGDMKGFTGVDDPYEEPLDPEVVCETEKESPEESVNKIIRVMEAQGYLKQRI